MPNSNPYSAIDIPEVLSRNQAARDIVSGFASAAPTLSAAWQHIQTALADARYLATELTRLSAELAERASLARECACRDARHDRRTARRRTRPLVLHPR